MIVPRLDKTLPQFVVAGHEILAHDLKETQTGPQPRNSNWSIPVL